MDDRLSPEETKMVLARVAELQTARDGSDGTSRDELVKVVGEAGLDTSLVEKAMQEVLGTRVEVDVETVKSTVVATCEIPRWLSNNDLRDLSLRLGHEFGGTGQFVQQGDAYWWVRQGPGSPIAMSVRHVSTGTLVRLEIGAKVNTGRSALAGIASAAAAFVLGTALLSVPGIVIFSAGVALGFVASAADTRLQRLQLTNANAERARQALGDGLGKLPLPPPAAASQPRMIQGGAGGA